MQFCVLVQVVFEAHLHSELSALSLRQPDLHCKV